MIEINQAREKRITHAFYKQAKESCFLYNRSGRGSATITTKATDVIVDSIQINVVSSNGLPTTHPFPFNPTGMQLAAEFMSNLANSPKGPSLAKEGDLIGVSA